MLDSVSTVGKCWPVFFVTPQESFFLGVQVFEEKNKIYGQVCIIFDSFAGAITNGGDMQDFFRVG